MSMVVDEKGGSEVRGKSDTVIVVDKRRGDGIVLCEGKTWSRKTIVKNIYC